MRFPVLAAVLAALATAACDSGGAEGALTISGPAAEVERFVETQIGLHPGLTVAETTQPAPGQSRVTLAIAEPATREDVVEVSERAMAARLDVAFTSGG